MIDSLVKELRSTTELMASHGAVNILLWDRHSNACLDAAETIECLTRERDEAREALKPFAAVVLPNSEWQSGWPDYAPLESALGAGSTALTIGHCRAARKALEASNE